MAEPKKGILAEFKEFILRGNVVDLAVAVVVGAAFGAMISALVRDVMTPLIAAIFGKPDFSNLTFTIHDSKFLYGDFINSVITFVSIALVVFFFVVKPLNFMMERRRRGEGDAETDDRPCPECLSTIPKEAKRCAFCTAEVTPIS